MEYPIFLTSAYSNHVCMFNPHTWSANFPIITDHVDIPFYALRYSSTCAHIGSPTKIVLSLTDTLSSILSLVTLLI